MIKNWTAIAFNQAPDAPNENHGDKGAKNMALKVGWFWGLINEVVPADQLMTAAKVWAQRVLKCSPVAIRATKQVVRKGLNNVSVEDAMAGQERGDYLALSEWSASHDTKEGIDAFVQKRSPEWRNS